ncbi:hypothetical protein M9H77_05087 [Catharanthus roseus]|uniref:Uncharacterized protein n=1 Tax=Catharanthus roseus TaxID=4058 RepID=A0ACC0CG46_CATRO|nr:hypothetical protein M9H77_05087 [Catharanthus roseus]
MVYDLVFGIVRGLRFTWLVSHTRASSNGVDDSDSGEWIHLKKGVDSRGCGPIGLRGHYIMLCCGVRPPSGNDMGVRLFCNQALVWCLAGIDYEMPKLGCDGLVLGIQTLSVEPHCCIICSFKFGA